jgi:hypothetical protein
MLMNSKKKANPTLISTRVAPAVTVSVDSAVVPAVTVSAVVPAVTVSAVVPAVTVSAVD